MNQYNKISLVEHLTKRNIKCYQHNNPLGYLDLSKVCGDRSRLKCEECQRNQNCVTINNFNNLCEQFYKNSKDVNEQLRESYKKIYSDIQNLLDEMKNNLQKTILKPQLNENIMNCLEQYIQFIYSCNFNYDSINSIKKIGIQEFEELTQCISEQVEFQQVEKKMIVKKQALDDQKQAQSNEYLDFLQQLNQMIHSFTRKNNLVTAINQNNNQFNQKLDQVKQYEFQSFDQDGQKLIAGVNQAIADIQLNFDQTILGVRYCEPCTNLFFWIKDGIQNKWIKDNTLKCYTKTLVYFKFSKLQNILITSGSDSENEIYLKSTKAQLKIFCFIANSWLIQQIYIPQNQPGLGQQRISCAIFNQDETEIIFAEGTRLIFLYKESKQYVLKHFQEKSSEIITDLALSNDGKILAVGACDQKVILWQINGIKLSQLQQIKLYNTPKRILFSQENHDLIICTKDGLVHCFSHHNQSNNIVYYENQKIFNNIAKIRTIEFSKDSSLLAIGGETNVLQLWKKNPQNQWKCVNESKQDNFIETICFGERSDVIYASSNNEVCIHRLF